MDGQTGWIFTLLITTCVLLQLCAAQGSCRGRCGEAFSRGQLCNCDYNCLTHGECCKDYEIVCTSRGSCRGRCGEVFQRGKECECDPDCVLHNTCCSDYHGHCGLSITSPATRNAAKSKPKPASETKSKDKSNVQPLKQPKKPDSESEERNRDYTESQVVATDAPLLLGPDVLTDAGVGPSVQKSLSELMPLTQDAAGPADLLLPPDSLSPTDLYPIIPPTSLTANVPGAAVGSGPIMPAAGTPPADSPQAGGSSPGKPLTIPIKVSLSISGHVGRGPSQPLSGPAPGAGRPSTLTDIAQALGASIPSPQVPSEASSSDLCNGLPIDAVTSLFNGSIIVFRGEFFWLLDPRTRTPGPAQNITEELGVPSPIDTAFTRCNCQGKTYIIKGDNYWSFENGVMEIGYPRSVSQNFGGLSGQISAALSVPATRKRPESIFFFKQGGTMQKLSYPPGSGPSCSGKRMKNSVYAKIRRARQAEIRLSAEININLNLKELPTPVTSALSMPNPRKPEGFEYFIFSWPKFFSVKITGELPALLSPAKPPADQNIRNWLNCP